MSDDHTKHQKSFPQKMSEFMKLKLTFFNLLLNLCLSCTVESRCQNTYTCNLALVSYNVLPGDSLTEISNYFNNSTMAIIDDIVSYNPTRIQNKDFIEASTRIQVPIPCGCVNDTFLGHIFSYTFQRGDTYENVAKYNFSNLTTSNWIEQFNGYSIYNVPDGALVNVPVNCSCGDSRVSMEYGLFVTYPLQLGETLNSISQQFNLSETLLQGFNPGVDFNAGTGLVYIPAKGNLLLLSMANS